jgi:hypothetical protein
VPRNLGFVHHSRVIFCRAVPNPNLTIRATFSSLHKGGGSAIPLRPRLLARLVAAAVAGVNDTGRAVPVTVKMRVGLSDDLPTFLQVRHARVTRTLVTPAFQRSGRSKSGRVGRREVFQAVRKGVSFPLQVNSRTHVPLRLKCLISLCTNPVSI